MTKNPEAEDFFRVLHAHSDVASEFEAVLAKCGEFELHHAPLAYGAPFAITAGTVFGGAAGMNATFWRLRPKDIETALATGAVAATFSPEWVQIELFRVGWPTPDLQFWALRAYDFARMRS